MSSASANPQDDNERLLTTRIRKTEETPAPQRRRRRRIAPAPPKPTSIIRYVVLLLTVLLFVIILIWYCWDLFQHGKQDVHWIAWFSAGAFVLMGFPVSILGILQHLSHMNQPKLQVYIVRILWMVPIYSVESWLAMRYFQHAIYIETLRDLYESYVLYSFLQFLIQVLGGQESLVLLLKDKSPTRGVHRWGLQYFMKPWIMGTPVRQGGQVRWTSPFFVQCQLGVLQYVWLKLVLTLVTMILEVHGHYHEGSFALHSGYLYVCILTNLSQCWALYCLIMFYYATKNELAPIRPVGKFLAVKALVFFTWWQSVFISILVKLEMIPHYTLKHNNVVWSPEHVAKMIQDYCICMEMFVAAVVHSFIFSHHEYTPAAVAARRAAWQHSASTRRRVGRRYYPKKELSSCADSVELMTLGSSDHVDHDFPISRPRSFDTNDVEYPASPPIQPLAEDDENDEFLNDSLATLEEDSSERTQQPSFVRALIDSTIPTDLTTNTVGIVNTHIERQTLLQHASTHDAYELFARQR